MCGSGGSRTQGELTDPSQPVHGRGQRRRTARGSVRGQRRKAGAAKVGPSVFVADNIAHGADDRASGSALGGRDVRTSGRAAARPVGRAPVARSDPVQAEAPCDRSGRGEKGTADRRIVGADEDQRFGAVVEVVVRVGEGGGVLRRGLPVADVEEVLQDRSARVRYVVHDDATRPLETSERKARAIRHDAGGHTLRLGALGVGPILKRRRSHVGVEGAVRAVLRRGGGLTQTAEIRLGDLGVTRSGDKLHVGARVPHERQLTGKSVPGEDRDGPTADAIRSAWRRRRRVCGTHRAVRGGTEVGFDFAHVALLAAAGVLREVARHEHGGEKPAKLRGVAAVKAIRVCVSKADFFAFDVRTDANHVLSVARVAFVGGDEVVQPSRREGGSLIGHEHLENRRVVRSPGGANGNGVVAVAWVHLRREQREAVHEEVRLVQHIPDDVGIVVLEDDEEVPSIIGESGALGLGVQSDVVRRGTVQAHALITERVRIDKSTIRKVVLRERVGGAREGRIAADDGDLAHRHGTLEVLRAVLGR
eukprot:scaffold4206_cov229-Pinguiococcus_pyrenoidosus.AAC.2